ncbi:ankyrin repeat domain-containing protein [bacterium]|nr:ankyrin repeat domain-containing protein [bacterium]
MKKLIILFLFILLMIPVCMAKSSDASLLRAVEKGNHGDLLKLLKNGANPNIITSDGEFTPLILAIDKNDVKAAQLLLDYGADPDFRSKRGLSPVLRLVIRNNPDDVEMLRLILEHGADYTAQHDFQYAVNPVSLSIKLKNYTAFNMFNDYKKFNKCDIAYYKMQGQMLKNAEHWKAIETWKSCKMMPLNDSLIGLSLDDIIQLYGKPVSTAHLGKDSMEVTYVNLYSKYVNNPANKKFWLVRKESPMDNKKILINRCKDYKSFVIDNNTVVDIKNSEYKGDNPIQYYQPRL